MTPTSSFLNNCSGLLLGISPCSVFHISILRVIKLIKTDITFSYCFVLSFWCISKPWHWGNVSYNFFTSSSMCSTNFSTQSLPRHICNESRKSPYVNVLCTEHPDSTCIGLLCIMCLNFSLSLHLIHLFSALFINWF